MLDKGQNGHPVENKEKLLEHPLKHWKRLPTYCRPGQTSSHKYRTN